MADIWNYFVAKERDLLGGSVIEEIKVAIAPDDQSGTLKAKASLRADTKLDAYLKVFERATRDVHVVPSGNLWACEIDSNIRSTHETQEEAIKEGRGLAEDQNGELVVHAQDGRIREKDSHGNDPRNIPG